MMRDSVMGNFIVRLKKVSFCALQTFILKNENSCRLLCSACCTSSPVLLLPFFSCGLQSVLKVKQEVSEAKGRHQQEAALR